MYRTLHYTPIDRDVPIRYSIAKNVQNKHDIHWTLSWNIVHVFIVISFHPCLGTRHNPPSDVDEISSTWLQFSWSVTNVNVTGIFALLVFCCVVITHSFTNRTKSVTHWNWLLLLGHWHRTPLWPTQRDVIHQPLIQLTTNSIYAYQRNQDMATWLAWDAPEGPQGNSDRRRRWW